MVHLDEALILTTLIECLYIHHNETTDEFDTSTVELDDDDELDELDVIGVEQSEEIDEYENSLV